MVSHNLMYNCYVIENQQLILNNCLVMATTDENTERAIVASLSCEKKYDCDYYPLVNLALVWKIQQLFVDGLPAENDDGFNATRSPW